jgi:L-alanine-DL-glutamate epimerase-like enolase superfamily enzyme
MMVETGACEVFGLKIGRVRGLTVARRICDVCIEAGVQMNIEDTGGSALQATAAVHLAQSPLSREERVHAYTPPSPFDGGSSRLPVRCAPRA